MTLDVILCDPPFVSSRIWKLITRILVSVIVTFGFMTAMKKNEKMQHVIRKNIFHNFIQRFEVQDLKKMNDIIRP